MMENNWENFLKNLGEWQGSFTSVSLQGELLESTPSILNLEGFENNQLVRLRLRRFGPDGYNEPPISDYLQDYRSLGRQVIFFETGAFSKGSMQVAPSSEFGAEYGFVTENRRLRFVQLYDDKGDLNRLILIREFRANTDASERPPLSADRLLGQWKGTAHTAYSDWQPSETHPTHSEFKDIGENYFQQHLSIGDRTYTSKAHREKNTLHFQEEPCPRKILLLPDGCSINSPLHVTHRQPFFVELGWLVQDNEHQRLIRNYNEKGEWISA
ncbi:MAG: DUF3598 family protein, partial [Acaryochloridaceae cyanobacterium RU_4_10]|nr:DUF3598 family protein [Acaryochloridaceae cyanobacterium RU_4_10]